MNCICFCMSTGRCGTTFLAHTLRATYPSDAEILHEDVREFQSKPRKYLWHLEEDDLKVMREDALVMAHLARIEALSRSRPYVDVGNSAVPLIPLFLETFSGRVRLLHLVREPITSAASMAAHSVYQPLFDGLEGPNYSFPPNPIQTRCAHPEFASSWKRMTPFEKNLWRWGEYHLFALAIHQRYPQVPYLKVFSVDLFRDGKTMRTIADFFGLPFRKIIPQPQFRNETHPNLTCSFPVGNEWKNYLEYPYIIELAKNLGVPIEHQRLDEQMKKYAAPSRWELAKYRWRLRFSRKWIKEKIRRLGFFSEAS